MTSDNKETFESYFIYLSKKDKPFFNTELNRLKQLHDKDIKDTRLEVFNQFQKENYVIECNKLLESADRGFKIIREEKDKQISELNKFLKEENINHIKELSKYRSEIKQLQAENEKLKNTLLMWNIK